MIKKVLIIIYLSAIIEKIIDKKSPSELLGLFFTPKQQWSSPQYFICCNNNYREYGFFIEVMKKLSTKELVDLVTTKRNK